MKYWSAPKHIFFTQIFINYPLFQERTMEATVAHFRQGKHHLNVHQMILKVANTAEDAKKAVGKTVLWTTPSGKEIKGKISALHGRTGSVRAIFAEKGLPGQALGQKVKIL
jgi:ribosomal protein L35AE/L33A